ncbi:nitrite reductase, copper-containing [Nitrosococcus wardiae]|uniref:Copper-containing nitrite reductase n=2 Tax=Nitrosococcus wardiae TaxID=1814290 RepID=A0A4P7C1I9_9GAMM|nr:nitrite reductase, copper-containing [Nitrosococcus wardiae]
MHFAGLRNEEDRENVIAYLKQAVNAFPRHAPVSPEGTKLQQVNSTESVAAYTPDLTLTLKTGIAEGRLVFIGVGADIEGEVNPTLEVHKGEVVQINLVNGEGTTHDIFFPEFNARSEQVTTSGSSTTLALRATSAGEFTYYCTLPGHREAGMEGRLLVRETPREELAKARDIVRNPNDVPQPVGDRESKKLELGLEAVELEGELAEGTTYHYWTFNGTVPGPLLRVRVGDTVKLKFANDIDSDIIHSVDLHAVTGPGGGAAYLQVPPGEEKSITFKALIPGLYVYHCATPMVAHHIANGMYGMILVEPEGGLPPVDREYYVMQGEIYTQASFGKKGRQEFSVEKLLDESPEYFVFNGATGALTQDYPLHAKVGETIRIFFGVGGPNLTSSFHIIGEIFDRVHEWGGLRNRPVEGIQTVPVAPGGAAIVELELEIPGKYILVDHALSRMERGLRGFLYAEGKEKPAIYQTGASFESDDRHPIRR